MARTRVWSDSDPPGSRTASEIDDAIRELREDVKECINQLIGQATLSTLPVDPLPTQLSSTPPVTIGTSFHIDASNNVVLGGTSPVAGAKITITGGHMRWTTDNSHDIGASGANRPRNLFLGGTVTATGTSSFVNITSSGTIQAAALRTEESSPSTSAGTASFDSGAEVPTGTTHIGWLTLHRGVQTVYVPIWA